MKDSVDKPRRKLSVNFSESRLEAYASIEYAPDSAGVYPPKFTLEEIKKEFTELKLAYGILEENLLSCTQEHKVQDILIARGDKPVDGEDDLLLLKFEVDKDIRNLNEDSRGRVDFKSIGSVSSVMKGEIIAERIPGKDGIEGKDVIGKVIKPKARKIIRLQASQGCELTDENTVVSTISGKPSMKNNVFYVYKTHEVPQDVDLNTGNISFLGDVSIQGSVREGMKVYSGNCITVMHNVERSEVKAKGDIIINENVIASQIVGGGEDAEKIKEIEELSDFEKSLKEMIAAIEEIKKFNLLGYDTTDGQMVKVLLESKFKNIPKLCMFLISQAVKGKQKGDVGLEEILGFVKAKLIGLAPHNIKHYSELFMLTELVKERIDVLNESLSIPVNVKFSYCQDSVIRSSGDIIVSGKGAYVSNLAAHNRVCFSQKGSVLRGGTVKAVSEIRCSKVGSSGGAVTRLSVGEKGHILAEEAYENTILAIGLREFVVDYSSKNVHAYLDENSELIIERIRL